MIKRLERAARLTEILDATEQAMHTAKRALHSKHGNIHAPLPYAVDIAYATLQLTQHARMLACTAYAMPHTSFAQRYAFADTLASVRYLIDNGLLHELAHIGEGSVYFAQNAIAHTMLRSDDIKHYSEACKAIREATATATQVRNDAYADSASAYSSPLYHTPAYGTRDAALYAEVLSYTVTDFVMLSHGIATLHAQCVGLSATLEYIDRTHAGEMTRAARECVHNSIYLLESICMTTHKMLDAMRTQAYARLEEAFDTHYTSRIDALTLAVNSQQTRDDMSELCAITNNAFTFPETYFKECSGNVLETNCQLDTSLYASAYEAHAHAGKLYSTLHNYTTAAHASRAAYGDKAFNALCEFNDEIARIRKEREADARHAMCSTL